MHDADCMLEMFAPPSRVASVTSNNVPTETKTLEAASSSALSPVIESPQKRRGGGYLGDETATSSTIPSMEPSSQISRSNSAVKQRQSASRGNAVAHISLPTSIHEVHTPARPTSVTKSGMELHSTEAVAQKADVVSRPSTGMSLASTVLRPRGPPSPRARCSPGSGRTRPARVARRWPGGTAASCSLSGRRSNPAPCPA